MKKFLAELIGTFALVLVGCGSAVGANALFTALGMGLPVAFTSLLIAAAFGGTCIAMYYTFSSISGAHLNPAVSLGMLVQGRMGVKDFFLYIVAQFIGAIAGAGVLALFVQGRTSLDANAYGSSSTFGITLYMALGIELVMTFLFVLVFLRVTEDKEKTAASGLIIGIALAAVYLFSIPFTGGCANPARAFGPAIIQLSTAISQVWVFIVAPFIGGLLAGLVNKVFSSEPKLKVAEVEAAGEDTDEIEETAEDKKAAKEAKKAAKEAAKEAKKAEKDPIGAALDKEEAEEETEETEDAKN